MGHFEEVEEAWALSEAAREFASSLGEDPSIELYLEKIFAPSPLVDLERTQREGGSPLQRIFLRSPYGLQWRPQFKDWIPFRHGEIEIE